MLTEELKNLTESEKLLLINELWDDITQEPSGIHLTDDLQHKLDQRYREFLENPNTGKSWEEYRDLVESLGLDPEPEVLKQLRQSKAERSRGDFSAYVSLDEV